MDVSHITHFELTAVKYDHHTVTSVVTFCLKISIAKILIYIRTNQCTIFPKLKPREPRPLSRRNSRACFFDRNMH